MTDDSWLEWKNHVLHEIERSNKQHEDMMERLRLIEKKITGLNFRASYMGLIMGLVPGMTYLIYMLIRGQ